LVVRVVVLLNFAVVTDNDTFTFGHKRPHVERR